MHVFLEFSQATVSTCVRSSVILYQVLPSQICIMAEAAVKRRAKLWRPAPGQEGTQIVAARLLPVLSKIVSEGGFHYDSTDPKTFRTRTKTCFLQERCRNVFLQESCRSVYEHVVASNNGYKFGFNIKHTLSIQRLATMSVV